MSHIERQERKNRAARQARVDGLVSQLVDTLSKPNRKGVPRKRPQSSDKAMVMLLDSERSD